MQIANTLGPGASTVKYDILTALLAIAAQDGGTPGRLALRLSLLMTARYNWRQACFTTGQREIARMWNVTERTAKRDLAQMRGMGWISVLRPAARGRVASHAVHIERILIDSMPRWPSIGPDFTARLTGRPETPDVRSADNVVPLHRADGDTDASPWGQAARVLQGQDAALFQAWFARLRVVGQGDGTLHLMAPSAFVARYVETHFAGLLLAALARADGGVKALTISA